MYAKFRFLDTTTNAVRNRTLVKAITDCYDGVGPANFDGYAGIDSDRSYFYSKDSSHWTFSGAGGAQSLNGSTGTTGLDWDATAARGSAYTLKCTYDTGHTVYCDVRLRGNVTNSGIYNGAGNGCTSLVVRNRYGTSIEDMQYGNTTLTNPADADVRGMGVAHNLNREIHVMADQTKLVLVGSNQYLASEREACMVYQFDRPSQMRYRDKINTIADSNVPVCAQFVTAGNGVTTATGIGYRDNGAYGSTWDNTTAKAPIVMFPGNIYNERTSDKLRNFALHGSGAMAGDAVADDDVTQTPFNSPSIDPIGGYYAQSNQHRGWFYGTEWGGIGNRDQERFDAINGAAYDIDSNGNKAIRLTPMYMDFHSLGGDEVNMSAKAGIYLTIGNAGFFGDSATISGQKYQYFPLSALNALMIRRD